MTYVVAIPTYHRSDQLARKSLKTLQEGHVPAGVIYLFVATPEEKAAYEKAIAPHLYHQIIVGQPGIANQRNFIRHYFPVGHHVVSIDDDIEGVYRRVNDHQLRRLRNLHPFFLQTFRNLQQKNLKLWGVYPVRNPFFMRPGVSTDLSFVIGALHGYIVRHDDDLDVSPKAEGKEDYEQSLLYFRKDGGVLRFNDVALKTRFLGPGGLGPQRRKTNKQAAAYLQRTYPDVVTRFQRKNGMDEVRLTRKHKPPL